jgi:hypothetical protein
MAQHGGRFERLQLCQQDVGLPSMIWSIVVRSNRRALDLLTMAASEQDARPECCESQ